uniref:Ig-like domain-containing protein n=1 Tax=Meloidogyne javanica TaxID=6303 RepID=A0A915M9X8_MELJA
MIFGSVLNITTILSLSCLQTPDQCEDESTSHPPPIIQYGHQNQTLMLNDMAILPCQATGRLPVVINWMKDDMLLDLNSSDYKNRYRQQSMGTLQISDLK